MVHYNTLNVKFSDSQLNKLSSGIQNGTLVTLNLSTNAIDDANDKASFLHKLLRTNMQVSKIRKAFANISATNINFSRNQLSKMVQLFEFLVKLFGTLIKTGFSLMGNVLKPLAKNVWVLFFQIKN